MIRTIFDIMRLYLENPRRGIYDLEIDIFMINFAQHLEIRLLSEGWWFTFTSEEENGSVYIDRPNKTCGYDTIALDPEIFQDLFTMDDNQLILTYGKFYPDYLSGDLTELYNAIKKKIIP